MKTLLVIAAMVVTSFLSFCFGIYLCEGEKDR